MTDQFNETASENKNKGQIYQIFCLECRRPTRHLVTVSLEKNGEAWNRSEEWSVDWTDHYQILECQGCSTITFRHANWFSENQFFDDDGIVERLYPLRKDGSLAARSYQNVPTNLRRIYSELVDCFNAESNTLCAAGLRALVEGVCAQQGIIDGPVEIPAKGGGMQTVRKDDLRGRINGLHEKGLLTEASAQTLQEHRYMGNSAVHELTRPSDVELKLAIEILEHALDALYEIPEKAAQLRARRKV